VRSVTCGHPPPLLLRANHVVTLEASQPAPPLGLAPLLSTTYCTDTCSFCTGALVGVGVGAQDRGDAEVEDLHRAVFRHQDVGGLKAAVGNWHGVRMGHRQRLVGVDVVAQEDPVDELHHQVQLLVRGVEYGVIDLRDAGTPGRRDAGCVR
jgi:hypothetical protein